MTEKLSAGDRVKVACPEFGGKPYCTVNSDLKTATVGHHRKFYGAMERCAGTGESVPIPKLQIKI